MATRRKVTKKSDRKKRDKDGESFAKGAAIAVCKGSASAVLGAGVGTTEVLVSERAATGARLAIGVGGVIADMYIDDEEHPIAATVGQAALHGTAFSAGEKYSKKGIRALIDRNRDKRRKEDLAAMKADMEAFHDDEAKGDDDSKRNGVQVPVAKKKKVDTNERPRAEE